MSWFCVSNNDKHFIVYIFVWYWITFTVSRSYCYNCVILNLKLPINLLHYNHGFCVWINLFWLCSDWHKFNIVIHSQNLSTCLSFDIFFCNILWFIIEKTMWVPRPSHTSHINLIFLILRIVNYNTWNSSTHSWSSNAWESIRAFSREISLSIDIAHSSISWLSWSLLRF